MDVYTSEWWKHTQMGGPFWKEKDEKEAWKRVCVITNNHQLRVLRDRVNKFNKLQKDNKDKDDIISPTKHHRRYSESDVMAIANSSSSNTKPAFLNNQSQAQKVAFANSIAANQTGRFHAIKRGNKRCYKLCGYSSHLKYWNIVKTDRKTVFQVQSAMATLSKEEGDPNSFRYNPYLNVEYGTITDPLKFFRGGDDWNKINPETEVISIDVYMPPWRIDKDAADKSIALPLDEMMPLVDYRSLRVLKLTGMMRSYQKYIWETAWLNPQLTDLWLEMDFAPVVRRTHPADWPEIGAYWSPFPLDDDKGAEMYHGCGDGALNPMLGTGEYLDKMVIEKARLRAMMRAPTSRKLPVKNLTLVGFVVDAAPFHLWFDAERLRRIKFRDACIDAGFYLPPSMADKVDIILPSGETIEHEPATIDKDKEPKLVAVKKVKVLNDDDENEPEPEPEGKAQRKHLDGTPCTKGCQCGQTQTKTKTKKTKKKSSRLMGPFAPSAAEKRERSWDQIQEMNEMLLFAVLGRDAQTSRVQDQCLSDGEVVPRRKSWVGDDEVQPKRRKKDKDGEANSKRQGSKRVKWDRDGNN